MRRVCRGSALARTTGFFCAGENWKCSPKTRCFASFRSLVTFSGEASSSESSCWLCASLAKTLFFWMDCRGLSKALFEEDSTE